MDLAIYDLKLHKGRFIATLIGVGLLFTIVLAMNGLIGMISTKAWRSSKPPTRTFGW